MLGAAGGLRARVARSNGRSRGLTHLAGSPGGRRHIAPPCRCAFVRLSRLGHCHLEATHDVGAVCGGAPFAQMGTLVSNHPGLASQSGPCHFAMGPIQTAPSMRRQIKTIIDSLLAAHVHTTAQETQTGILRKCSPKVRSQCFGADGGAHFITSISAFAWRLLALLFLSQSPKAHF